MRDLEHNKKSRQLYLLDLLNNQTDEEHPITMNEIIKQLSTLGFSATRKTIAEDIAMLIDFDVDIVCNKSSQNQYFVGTRQLELHELKLLVDAVESSKFITKKKSVELIFKLSKLASVYQADSLKRGLYTDTRIKPSNEAVYIIADTISKAIHSGKQVELQYYEYNQNKEKTLKHNGQVYVFSPYALAWNGDNYYVFGFSQNHNKLIKFRVDRIHKPHMTDNNAVPCPKDFNIAEFSKSVFNMYDTELKTVELFCTNELMKVIIDKFGKEVETKPFDSQRFIATVDVSASPTFFGWVFQFVGKMRILSPQSVADEFKSIATEFCK